jgi:hypothetical protein
VVLLSPISVTPLGARFQIVFEGYYLSFRTRTAAVSCFSGELSYHILESSIATIAHSYRSAHLPQSSSQVVEPSRWMMCVVVEETLNDRILIASTAFARRPSNAPVDIPAV